MSKEWNDLAELKESNEEFNNLLIIDGNNLAFRFIKRNNFDCYEQEYVRTVSSLGRSYKARDVFVAFDFGKSYYRKELLDEYKATRVKPQETEEQEHYKKFFEVLDTIPSLIDNPLKYRGVEADDLIAWLVYNVKSQYDHIWITSSDKDIIQLVDDKVSIFNLFSRKEIDVDYLFSELDVTSSEFMLSRVIQGDTSDNITGVEGIGPKRSQTLAREYKTLDNLIKALPLKGRAKYIKNLNNSKDMLLLNEKLINLKNYNEQAILAGKDGEQVLQDLKNRFL